MSDEGELDRRLSEFREKAEPLGVVVARVGSVHHAAVAVGEWAETLGADRVVVSSELRGRAPEVWDAIVARGLEVRPSGSAEAMRDAPLGLSLGRLAIAETGSVLLAEGSLEDRAVGMLSMAHGVLCATSQLVDSLDDAVADLRAVAMARGASFATLVTGPSRTADIERVLTVGVQGPGKVMTLFVDDL